MASGGGRSAHRLALLPRAASLAPSIWYNPPLSAMKLATFNVNSIRVRLPIVLDWLERQQPDILCLQETKVQDDHFPALAFAGLGYQVAYRGMKSYNGVAVVSRRPPDAVYYGFDDHAAEPDDERLMRLTFGDLTVINTYVPNGFKIHSPKYTYKLGWFTRLRLYFDKHLSPSEPVIWCGDMNVAPEPIDVHSPEKHLTHVCFHEDVRRAYQDTLAWGFVDVFRALYPDRQQFTFWDYLRPSSLEKNKGWRIDHILATAPLAKRCTTVDVDIEPRRAANPSDHTFLWADFAL